MTSDAPEGPAMDVDAAADEEEYYYVTVTQGFVGKLFMGDGFLLSSMQARFLGPYNVCFF